MQDYGLPAIDVLGITTLDKITHKTSSGKLTHTITSTL